MKDNEKKAFNKSHYMPGPRSLYHIRMENWGWGEPSRAMRVEMKL